MPREELLELIRKTVLETEPVAKMILYGSRARGESSPDSDWDLLVLLSGPVHEDRKRNVRRRLYEVEWETGEVISAVVHSQEEWSDARLKATPYHECIEREGVAL